MRYEDEDDAAGLFRHELAMGRAPGEVRELIEAVEVDSPPGQVAAMLDAAEALLERAKAAHDAAYRVGGAWVAANGPVPVGGVGSVGGWEYRLERASVGRCLDAVTAGHVLLNAVHADFDAFMRLLVPDPFRRDEAAGLLEVGLREELFARGAMRLVRRRVGDGSPGGEGGRP